MKAHATTISVSRETESNMKRSELVACRLTPAEMREFKKLAKHIGLAQFARLLITQALDKAKHEGIQIILKL